MGEKCLKCFTLTSSINSLITQCFHYDDDNDDNGVDNTSGKKRCKLNQNILGKIYLTLILMKTLTIILNSKHRLTSSSITVHSCLFAECYVGWLAGWLAGWLVGWLAGWPLAETRAVYSKQNE
uniref:Uncharacterized protein n=1 Tax=Glossina brevipalpis TaxID=37001 RepID=A0A1A9WXB1_9MUSC